MITRRGFTLIELMVGLVLVVAVGAVTYALLVQNQDQTTFTSRYLQTLSSVQGKFQTADSALSSVITELNRALTLGVPSLGGPLITAGGVTFLTSTLDYYIRAYDVSTGQQLWQDRLPAGGQSTPMSYAIDGKQYVVTAAGGHGSFGTKLGDYVIAYTLGD